MTRLTNARSVVVTISRSYGAGGLGVADGVARALGYALVADDLPKDVAARVGTTETVAELATTEPSFYERLLRGLGAGTPEVATPASRLPTDLDESLRREIEHAIRARASRGDAVILGRSGAQVLAGERDLVRVFVGGGRAWRAERLMEMFAYSRERAEAEIDRVDGARRKFAKDRYGAAWGDARSYDLIVDASRFGIDGAVEVIVAAVHAAQATGA